MDLDMLRSCSVFELLDDATLQEMAERFVARSYELGENIVTQSMAGDAFFVIRHGRARVTLQGDDREETTVGFVGPGDHFGERALVTGEPRGQTVRATEHVEVLRLDKDAFDSLVADNPRIRRYFETYISDLALRNFLKTVTVFSSVPHVKIKELLDSFARRVYEPGMVIIQEGELGDAFYLVHAGRVRVEKTSEGGRVLCRLGRGAFFGEMAILSDRPRAATVIAEQRTECFRMPKAEFLELTDEVPALRQALAAVCSGYTLEPEERPPAPARKRPAEVDPSTAVD